MRLHFIWAVCLQCSLVHALPRPPQQQQQEEQEQQQQQDVTDQTEDYDELVGGVGGKYYVI